MPPASRISSYNEHHINRRCGRNGLPNSMTSMIAGLTIRRILWNRSIAKSPPTVMYGEVSSDTASSSEADRSLLKWLDLVVRQLLRSRSI